jgi:Ankyrin repeats (3 copies)
MRKGSKKLAAILLEKAAIFAIFVKNANTYNESPLLVACRQGNVEIIEILLTQGSSLNEKGKLKQSPLHNAAGSGKEAAVRYLIRQGADLDSKDTYGYTPLHYALDQSHLSMIIVLLNCGAKICKPFSKKIPLHSQKILKNYLRLRDQTPPLYKFLNPTQDKVPPLKKLVTYYIKNSALFANVKQRIPSELMDELYFGVPLLQKNATHSVI